VAESCPGAAGQACPADVFAEQGVSCNADANPCTTDACDGAGNCAAANNEAGCDDGLFCTVNDTCVEGACVGSPRDCSDANSCTDDGCSEAGDTCTHVANDAPCSDGNACTLVDACVDSQCVGSSPVDCDDGDVCTVDACEPGTGECDNQEAPRTDCHQFGTTSLILSDPDGSGLKAKLKWAWSKGTPTLLEEFGDPTDDTDYSLCIYDTEGGVSALATRLDIPAGPPWQARSDRGFRRKDGAGLSDGLTKAVLRTNGKGKGDLVFKGGFCQRCSSSAAQNLPLPALSGGGGFLSNEPTVSAQLVASNGQCWLSEFQTIRTNTTERFSARARQE
jgi:hypothetical protein